MPSVTERPIGRAEAAFVAAFDRLKANSPQRLPAGTPVTQSNVAREAGLDPSALKKSRFPELIADIQTWVAAAPTAPLVPGSEVGQTRRRNNRSLRERLLSIKEQRDKALSLLAQADAHILALSHENARLKALLPEENVVHLGGAI